MLDKKRTRKGQEKDILYTVLLSHIWSLSSTLLGYPKKLTEVFNRIKINGKLSFLLKI